MQNKFLRLDFFFQLSCIWCNSSSSEKLNISWSWIIWNWKEINWKFFLELQIRVLNGVRLKNEIDSICRLEIIAFAKWATKTHLGYPNWVQSNRFWPPVFHLSLISSKWFRAIFLRFLTRNVDFLDLTWVLRKMVDTITNSGP